MKILIADFLFVDAHKDMNINFINAIRLFADADVISLNGYYDEQREAFQNNNIGLLDISVERRTGPLGSRRFSLELMKISAAYAKAERYNAVLCLGFETMLFGLGLSYFKRLPLFIFHHKNIDELTSKVKRTAFGSYKNKVYHVVFEEFFKGRLVNSIGVLENSVFVVPHPAKQIVNVQTGKSFDCVGLCNSNDEAFIQEAIAKDSDFLQHNIHILLRSKTQEKTGGAVEVIKGFMEKDSYDELMAAGKAVFAPLPATYIYRLSGSIYDALAREKLVYTTSKYYAEEYERRYPGTCQYVGSVDQLIDKLQKKGSDDTSASFQKFIKDHSIETVSHKIEKMVKDVLEVSQI